MTARQLADLIDTYAPALVLFARQWCAAPEDVVQDAFCKLASQAAVPDDPVAWLYRVTRNAAIDTGKAERRRSRREAVVARSVRWFDESAIDGLDAGAAVAALEDLPADEREVIVARLWGGMTLAQIAVVTVCSVSTAHRRYEAGLAALRERLGVICPKT
ncbi:RNA polymerase sigma factor [Fimbriiglobus ruber]|uniref:RNA polymerase, sigma-24 subunit, ECF subfamily n=1 Tax=Fimbriiglobus ruber TaxID=1908690 RepID=A0A225E000_9BACT|nr:sigma-70 family RNA polymerase sigma factor [Fimbriiglobus ruber]OWK46553.1 RNA polymerase, sigma-24 subunit, ECF subfamily [Fimbriiglobus ruber]